MLVKDIWLKIRARDFIRKTDISSAVWNSQSTHTHTQTLNRSYITFFLTLSMFLFRRDGIWIFAPFMIYDCSSYNSIYGVLRNCHFIVLGLFSCECFVNSKCFAYFGVNSAAYSLSLLLSLSFSFILLPFLLITLVEGEWSPIQSSIWWLPKPSLM